MHSSLPASSHTHSSRPPSLEPWSPKPYSPPHTYTAHPPPNPETMQPTSNSSRSSSTHVTIDGLPELMDATMPEWGSSPVIVGQGENQMSHDPSILMYEQCLIEGVGQGRGQPWVLSNA